MVLAPQLSRKLVIVLAVAVVVFGIVLYLPNSYLWHDTDADLAGKLSACGLSAITGEPVSVIQGTVATVGIDALFSLGVRSITGNMAYISMWDPEDRTSERKVTLGTCEGADFKGSRVYVLAINDRMQNPFGGTGNSNGSIELFVAKSPAR